MTTHTLKSPAASFHASNLLTYVSLLSAIGAIAVSARGNAAAAGALLAFAVIADTFDGLFARQFARDDAQQAFGAQIDSLADAIAFGIAPVVCASLLTGWTGAMGPLYWLAGFVFAACAITRLAHFNLHQEAGRGFVGVPVPVAALLWVTALLFSRDAAVTAAIMVAAAALMILPVPIPRPRGLGLALFALWPVTALAMHALALR